MTDERTPPSPGWYPDPQMADTVRYWDGSRWTEHVAPAGQSAGLQTPPSPSPATAATEGEKKPDNLAKGCGLGCLVIIAIVAVTFLVGALGGDGDDGEDDGGGEFGARAICEQFVEDRLKAPATADFSDTTAFATGGTSWTVEGAVDAENSFGAKIRNTYVCKVSYTGDDMWRLDDLTMSEN